MPNKKTKKAATNKRATTRGKTASRKTKKAIAPTPTSSLRQRESAALSNPFAEMRRLSDEMEQLFHGVGPRGLRFPRLWQDQDLPELWGPDVDMFERGGQLVVRADLPGLKEKDVTVEISDSALTIKGERRSETKTKTEKDGYYRSERSYGSFSRVMGLPQGVNTDRAEAIFKDGVLEVTMPAATEPKKAGRRVQVKK